MEGEFRSLSPDVQAKFDRIVDLIQSHGLGNIGRPYVAPVRGKIWEIRLKSNGARGLYVTRKGERVVILRFFDKKTQKTPKKEIDLAEDRLKQRQKESTDPRRRL